MIQVIWFEGGSSPQRHGGTEGHRDYLFLVRQHRLQGVAPCVRKSSDHGGHRPAQGRQSFGLRVVLHHGGTGGTEGHRDDFLKCVYSACRESLLMCEAPMAYEGHRSPRRQEATVL
jgi:hypothetical protein